jgi:hypothetical protein
MLKLFIFYVRQNDISCVRHNLFAIKSQKRLIYMCEKIGKLSALDFCDVLDFFEIDLQFESSRCFQFSFTDFSLVYRSAPPSLRYFQGHSP